MISSELKLVPMWPDQAPRDHVERVDARQRRERAARRADRQSGAAQQPLGTPTTGT